jgi:DNA repair exonuclease SbcCD nuclease subunit
MFKEPSSHLNDIVIVGDVHEGINFDIKVDPRTGVSERALDMHGNLKNAAQFAIEKKASLFIILGDLFDRTHVAPIFREYVRDDVIEPLWKAGIKVYILAGNHDQPREFLRGTSIDDFRGYPTVSVFRKPQLRMENIAGKKIAFIIMPFLYPDTIIDQAGQNLSEVPEEQRQETGRAIVKELLKKYSRDAADARILLAHYYFEGADLSSVSNPEIEPGEIQFTQSMIPENIDLAVFGHVHLGQVKNVRNTPLIFVGSVERIDWGERAGEKHFLSIDPNDLKWQLHKLNTRDMMRIRVKIDSMDKNPTETVLKNIPSDVADKLVRLEIEVPEEKKRLITESRIGNRLSSAFHYQVRWIPVGPQNIIVPKIGSSFSNPYELFESFLQLNYAKHRRRDALTAKGKEILKEALET